MNNCVFARSRNAHRLYVWQNGVFLFWMDAKKRWARSDLVQHLYDEAYCKDPDVTPEEWFVDSSDFATLAEFGRWLEAEGLQAIATRVSTGGECQIIIEDGRVKDTEDAPAWRKGAF